MLRKLSLMLKIKRRGVFFVPFGSCQIMYFLVCLCFISWLILRLFIDCQGKRLVFGAFYKFAEASIFLREFSFMWKWHTRISTCRFSLLISSIQYGHADFQESYDFTMLYRYSFYDVDVTMFILRYLYYDVHITVFVLRCSYEK